MLIRSFLLYFVCRVNSQPDKTLWGEPLCSYFAEGGTQSWNTWEFNAIGFCSDLNARYPSYSCFNCTANDEVIAYDEIYSDSNTETHSFDCNKPICGAEVSRSTNCNFVYETRAYPLGVCFYEGFGYWQKYGCCSNTSSNFPGRLFFFQYTDDSGICDDCESGCVLDSLLDIIILPQTAECGDYEQLWDRFDGWDTSDYIEPPYTFQVSNNIICNEENIYDCDNLQAPDLNDDVLSVFGDNPFIMLAVIALVIAFVVILILMVFLYVKRRKSTKEHHMKQEQEIAMT